MVPSPGQIASKSAAYINIVCAPLNVLLKVRFSVIVKAFPEPPTVDPVPFNVHWLFCRLRLEPSPNGPSEPVPESLSR